MINKSTIKELILLFGSLTLLQAAEITANTHQNPDASAQANNPLAKMKAFNLQNYYLGDLTQTDENANQFWMRYAQPLSVDNTEWLVRASLPVNTFPTASNGDKETGTGDLNVFAAYLIDTGNPAISFGIGPQITLPTASRDELGSEKYSAGFANVLFDASSKIFQFGYLLTWQGSFAGNDNREDLNEGAFQPFAFLQLGKGTYLRAAPIWQYDFKNDAYNMPLGIGIGQVVKKDKTVFNFFIEPQFSVAHAGAGQAMWQVFTGFNMQFLK